MGGFLPRTDAGLLAWAEAFSSQISAAAASFGVPAGTATSLASTVSAYADAFAAATNESTRTKGTVAAKNTARTNLRQAASDVAKLVYGTSTVTDQQIVDLGLTIVDRNPTPVAPPAVAPVVSVLSVIGRMVRYRLADASVQGSRRRPGNARGALVLSYVGETPPTPQSGWTIQGETGKTVCTVLFPETVGAGTKCWVTAMWVGTRGEFSPACDPVSTYLQVGPVAQAA